MECVGAKTPAKQVGAGCSYGGPEPSQRYPGGHPEHGTTGQGERECRQTDTGDDDVRQDKQPFRKRQGPHVANRGADARWTDILRKAQPACHEPTRHE